MKNEEAILNQDYSQYHSFSLSFTFYSSLVLELCVLYFHYYSLNPPWFSLSFAQDQRKKKEKEKSYLYVLHHQFKHSFSYPVSQTLFSPFLLTMSCITRKATWSRHDQEKKGSNKENGHMSQFIFLSLLPSLSLSTEEETRRMHVKDHKTCYTITSRCHLLCSQKTSSIGWPEYGQFKMNELLSIPIFGAMNLIIGEPRTLILAKWTLLVTSFTAEQEYKPPSSNCMLVMLT